MRPPLERGDAVAMLGVTAVAALAVSLGVHPGVAVEVTVVVGLLLFVAVLLRRSPPRRGRRRASPRGGAVDEARSSVTAAMASTLGAEGGFRRRVRAAAIARLARDGRTIDDARTTLPPTVTALLDRDLQEHRGLTMAEIDLVLSTVEELP